MPKSSVQNPADLVNVSLARLGWKGGDIGNLYEGSPAANVALDAYGQVRDALLRSHPWDFAQRTAALALIKQAPVGGYFPPIVWDPTTYPPIGWLFEYGYPADCIKVRAVKPVPLFTPNFDPSTNTFSIANDPTLNPAQEVILCNLLNPVCIYTARVTDPTQFAVDFTEAFIDSLAESIAPGLANLDTAKLAAAEESASTEMATVEQG